MSVLSDSERIVVTGMGAITPLGPDAGSSWQRLQANEHGIVPTSESTLALERGYEKLGAKVVGAVQDFALPEEFGERRVKVDQKSMHRCALLGVTAVYQALKQADLLNENLIIDDAKVDPFRVGLYMGSTFSGGDHGVKTVGKEPLFPSDLFKTLLARSATALAMQFKTKNLSPLAGWECASGAVTADMGARSLLKYRSDMPPIADAAVVGGVDAPLSTANLRYFGALKRAVSPALNPDKASRPFDDKANGLVMGEAGGALVLETWAHAKARGLKPSDIQAELAGYASFTDAENKTKAGIEGAVKAMMQAMQMAKISVQETVYINAHATSTSEGDPIEARIIQESVRRLMLDTQDVWVSSTKGATGHTMGASGAIEAIFSILALQKNVIPPSLNLDNPIAAIQGLNLSPHTSTQDRLVDASVSNSFGFGGGATVLAFREFSA